VKKRRGVHSDHCTTLPKLTGPAIFPGCKKLKSRKGELGQEEPPTQGVGLGAVTPMRQSTEEKIPNQGGGVQSGRTNDGPGQLGLGKIFEEELKGPQNRPLTTKNGKVLRAGPR